MTSVMDMLMKNVSAQEMARARRASQQVAQAPGEPATSAGPPAEDDAVSEAPLAPEKGDAKLPALPPGVHRFMKQTRANLDKSTYRRFQAVHWGEARDAVAIAWKEEAERILCDFELKSSKDALAFLQSMDLSVASSATIEAKRCLLVESLQNGRIQQVEDRLCLVALKTLAHLDEVPSGFNLRSRPDGFHAEWSGKKGMLLKVHKSAAAACAFLQSMQAAEQSGAVEKSLKELENQGSAAGESQKAIRALLKHSSSQELGQAVLELADAETETPAVLATAEDITAEFLAPMSQMGPELCVAEVGVYKGMLRYLHSATDPRGLLAATSDLVCRDLILSSGTPLRDVLKTPELQERWKALDVKPVGMVVQGGASPQQHHEDLEILRQANPSAEQLLFMSFPGPISWQVQFNNGLQCCRAEPNSHVGRRAGRTSFTAARLEQLGVTFEDEARALALRAIQATTEAGNSRQQRLEAGAAYALRNLALEATADLEFPEWLARLAHNAAQQMPVDVQELHWLARSLELRIRCTVDAEGGSICISHNAQRLSFSAVLRSGVLYSIRCYLEVLQWVVGINEDAIYGDCTDDTYDVHVYFRCLTGEDGRRCSHFDLLLPYSEGDEQIGMVIPVPPTVKPAPVCEMYNDRFPGQQMEPMNDKPEEQNQENVLQGDEVETMAPQITEEQKDKQAESQEQRGEQIKEGTANSESPEQGEEPPMPAETPKLLTENRQDENAEKKEEDTETKGEAKNELPQQRQNQQVDIPDKNKDEAGETSHQGLEQQQEQADKQLHDEQREVEELEEEDKGEGGEEHQESDNGQQEEEQRQENNQGLQEKSQGGKEQEQELSEEAEADEKGEGGEKEQEVDAEQEEDDEGEGEEEEEDEEEQEKEEEEDEKEEEEEEEEQEDDEGEQAEEEEVHEVDPEVEPDEESRPANMETMLSIGKMEILQSIFQGEKTLEIRNRQLRPGRTWVCLKDRVYGTVDVGKPFRISDPKLWKARKADHCVQSNVPMYGEKTWANPVSNPRKLPEPLAFYRKHGAIGSVKYRPAEGAKNKKEEKKGEETNEEGDQSQSTTSASAPKKYAVATLSRTLMDRVREAANQKRKSFELLTTSRYTAGGEMLLVQTKTDNKVAIQASLVQHRRLTTTWELTKAAAYKQATAPEQTAWKARLHQHLAVYSCRLSNLRAPSTNIRLRGGHGCRRTVAVESDVVEEEATPKAEIPALSLRDTARYFLQRLSEADRGKLSANVKGLNGCEIKLGSTCSGTDVCTNVFKHTLQFLAEQHQVSISVKHVLAVELDKGKRDFLMRAHKPTFCLFETVDMFAKGKTAFCHTCRRVHEAPDVDVLVVGSSCKSISRMNNSRTDYQDCYQKGKGCSGSTYQNGVLQASKELAPALLFFEQVVGILDSPVQKNGKRKTPLVQAGRGT
ncbi:MDN1 [Symbiodinium sp. CCMP2592]|nr:MDN1 [Symbiodinium sp. CCMP2592]